MTVEANTDQEKDQDANDTVPAAAPSQQDAVAAPDDSATVAITSDGTVAPSAEDTVEATADTVEGEFDAA